MQVHIHKPHLELSAGFEEHVLTRVEEDLDQFAEWLTRIDVHFKDQNGQKGGVDKRCLIEARPRGLDPLTAENDGEEIRDAFHGALEKIHRVLDHQHGRRARNRRPGADHS